MTKSKDMDSKSFSRPGTIDRSHLQAIVDFWNPRAALHVLEVGDMVRVPACSLHDHGERSKSYPGIVTGIYGHKCEVFGGPSGAVECWDIKDLYWLQGKKHLKA